MEIFIIILLGIISLTLFDAYKRNKSRHTLFFAIMLSIASLVNLIILLIYV